MSFQMFFILCFTVIANNAFAAGPSATIHNPDGSTVTATSNGLSGSDAQGNPTNPQSPFGPPSVPQPNNDPVGATQHNADGSTTHSGPGGMSGTDAQGNPTNPVDPFGPPSVAQPNNDPVGATQHNADGSTTHSGPGGMSGTDTQGNPTNPANPFGPPSIPQPNNDPTGITVHHPDGTTTHAGPGGMQGDPLTPGLPDGDGPDGIWPANDVGGDIAFGGDPTVGTHEHGGEHGGSRHT